MRAGDWTPAQWYDGTLAETVRQIEQNPGAGTGRPAVQLRAGRPANRRRVRGFHSVSSKLRRTLLGEPEATYCPKAGKTGLAAKYAAQRSHLLIAMKMDTIAGRLSGLWTETPSFAYWVPVGTNDDDTAKALTAWWNGTRARLMLMNRRARKLTYPKWQVAHLREIRRYRSDHSKAHLERRARKGANSSGADARGELRPTAWADLHVDVTPHRRGATAPGRPPRRHSVTPRGRGSTAGLADGDPGAPAVLRLWFRLPAGSLVCLASQPGGHDPGCGPSSWCMGAGAHKEGP